MIIVVIRKSIAEAFSAKLNHCAISLLNAYLNNLAQQNAQYYMTHLKVGDQAPELKGTNELGEAVQLSDYAGKKLILFFYPKDNTPGCTAAACNLRDHYAELRQHGFEMLGVSPDSERKHQNFIKKFDFPFHLLADTERETLNAYGVWGPKQFMGRKFDGVHRTTFIISEDGKIEKIIAKVKTKNHAAQILDEMGLLTA